MMGRPVCSHEPTRAEAQRERILCAAQKCFIEHGFHAASMANIAETAGISAGLIYRYFENKSAIVLAIIERQLGESRRHVGQLRTCSDLAAELLGLFESWRARDPEVMNAALYLELSAEATRDPQIAQALRISDDAMRRDLEAWMSRDRSEGGLGLPPAIASTRVFILQCFVKGLAMCAVRNPDIDQAALRSAIDAQVERLLTP
jgi:AcrR family transcriptional regulator